MSGWPSDGALPVMNSRPAPGSAPARRSPRSPASPRPPPAPAMACDFDDSHFHLTNYIQEGPSAARRPEDHGRPRLPLDPVRHPAAAEWSYHVSGDIAPTYYLESDAPLYYYSFTDAVHRDGLPGAAAAGPGAVRPDDHRLQSGRHVRRRSRPARADACSRACSRASASSPSTRSSSPRRSPAGPASLIDPALGPAARLRRRRRPGRAHPQRHRHAVHQAGEGAALLRPAEGAVRARIPRRRSSGRTSGSGGWSSR